MASRIGDKRRNRTTIRRKQTLNPSSSRRINCGPQYEYYRRILPDTDMRPGQGEIQTSCTGSLFATAWDVSLCSFDNNLVLTFSNKAFAC